MRQRFVAALLPVLLIAGGAAPPDVRTLATPALPGETILTPATPSLAMPPEQWLGLAGQREVRNVSVPTLTPVLPDPATATGSAVIVAPGGAFRMLSIDGEGFDVARLLADRGIAAFVLKYRLTASTSPPDRFPAEMTRLFIGAARSERLVDPLFGHKGFGLVESWLGAHRPVELHAYEAGGHGFGTRLQGKTSDGWIDDWLRWLRGRGLAR